MNDKEIISLFDERNEKAIEEISRKYGGYCHSIAKNILRNDEDAEECVNDAYLKLWESVREKNPGNLKLFLAKIVRNIALNKYEANKCEKRGGGEVTLALKELDELLPAACDTEKSVEQRELTRCIGNYVNQMREPERGVFLCRYWYLAPVKEIAARFAFSESKVKSMLLRSRKKLKTELEREGYL